jgi:hypothetical protein
MFWQRLFAYEYAGCRIRLPFANAGYPKEDKLSG